jgi:hypothetical protein
MENHYTELKRTYDQTGGGSREMAKDLAALALDSGGLVIGVDEDNVGRAVTVVPVDLAGFAERVDQVALHRCDPPVPVRITTLPDPADEKTGILVVEVPAHPLAPIMVDGRYYGRGDRTVRQLSDAEVVRLHQARAAEVDRIEQTLEEADRRLGLTIPLDEAGVGRLLVVAEPAPIGRPDLMADTYSGPDWFRWQQNADNAAAAYVQSQDARSAVLAECLYSGPFSPLRQVRGGTAPSRQASGVLVRGGPRTASEDRSGSLELDESGALCLGINNFIALERNLSVLDWHFVISSTVYMVGMFLQVCETSGVRSQLDMGVFLRDVHRAVARPPIGRHGAPDWASVEHGYPAGLYRRTTRITIAELDGDLAPAMERLWGPLLRSLGLGGRLRATRTS